MPEGEIVWRNNQDGNDHTLVATPADDGSELVLTIVKPGGSSKTMGPEKSHSTVEQWRKAYEGLGAKWNQTEGSEVIEGPRYRAERTTQTATEVATWDVDHERLTGEHIEGVQYELRDRFHVALLVQVASEAGEEQLGEA